MVNNDAGYKKVNQYCVHCGMQLEAKFNYNHGLSFVIDGCYPTKVQHANGDKFCTIQYTATAYSDWDLNRELSKLAKEPDDER